jgi:hypothetical protein
LQLSIFTLSKTAFTAKGEEGEEEGQEEGRELKESPKKRILRGRGSGGPAWSCLCSKAALSMKEFLR